MDTKNACKCGKEAVGFTSDEDWICLDCLDNKITGTKKINPFNNIINTKIACKCGKKAVGFTSDEDWICLDCLDNKITEAKKIRSGFRIYNMASAP